MAQVVTKLKVESAEYDAKVKRAAQGLQHLEEECRKTGKSMNTITVEQKKFVQSLGQMQTVSHSTKGRINELSTAFIDLKSQYNRLTEEEKKGEFGRALSSSLDQLKTRVHAAKQELADMQRELDGNSGGSSGGGTLMKGGKLDGMLQVLGGNLMTKGVMMLGNMANEMKQLVLEGIELAKAGEGVRMAFERLGRPEILDGLRQATHGTVTDIELMKAAVKFNDFKLPLEELGTMLAFAQQKAKDTGQSVDYMVDSIVTGLGRKSLLILDNLGLSSAEIKDKMKETGDMTKAVGEIIREQMAKAGDYVETAADRATKADVELKNAMEELGRTFQPLTDTANSMWNTIKIGALDLLNNAVKPLIDHFTILGKQRAAFENAGGSGKVKQQLERLRGSNFKNYQYNAVVNAYKKRISEYENAAKMWDRWRSTGHGGVSAAQIGVIRDKYGTDTASIRAQAEAERRQLQEYMTGARSILFPSKTIPKSTPIVGGGGGGGRGGGRITPVVSTEEILPVGSVAALNKELSELRKKQEEATTTDGWLNLQAQIDGVDTKIKILKGAIADPNKIQKGGGASVLGIGIKQNELNKVQEELNKMVPEGGLKIPAKLDLKPDAGKGIVKQGKDTEDSWKAAASAVQSVGSALQAIDDPGAKVAGMIATAIANIAVGFAQAAAQEGKGGVWYWIAATAAGLATMVSTISAIHSSTGFAEGGIVGGNHFSGDNIKANGGQIGLNAGELVLNKAQQGNLASQLQESGGMGFAPSNISGEQIYVVLNRYTRRSGKGEIVTWR